MKSSETHNYIKLWARDLRDFRLDNGAIGIKSFLTEELKDSLINITYDNDLETITLVVSGSFKVLNKFLQTYKEDFETEFDYMDLFSGIELSEGFEEIGQDALWTNYVDNNGMINNIILPATIKHIRCAIDKRNVYINDLISWCNIDFNGNPNPASNGGHLYLNNIEITNLEIPEEVSKISNYAFYDINSITHINILGTNTIFYEHTFSNCKNLEYLKSYASIPDNAFYIESNPNIESKLKTVDLYCSTIGEEAFYNNNNLTKVILHDAITSIGNGAFYSCNKLYQVVSKSTNPIWNLQTDCYCFQGVAEGFRIYVPLNYKNTYINNNPYFSSNSDWFVEGFDGEEQLCPYNDQIWYSNSTDYIIKNYDYPLVIIDQNITAEFKQNAKIWLPDSVITIDSNAFKQYTKLENIILPNSITTIKNDAFAYCYKLNNVTLPIGLTVIEGGAFGACTSLTKITIPKNVTSIGNQAFFGCSNLATVTVGNILGSSNLTSIGHTAFKSCNLSSILIPSKVTFIGYEAFSNNNNLTKVNCKMSSPATVSLNANGIWNAFGSNSTLTIAVPKLSLEYLSATGWREYEDKIVKSTIK